MCVCRAPLGEHVHVCARSTVTEGAGGVWMLVAESTYSSPACGLASCVRGGGYREFTLTARYSRNFYSGAGRVAWGAPGDLGVMPTRADLV